MVLVVKTLTIRKTIRATIGMNLSKIIVKVIEHKKFHAFVTCALLLADVAGFATTNNEVFATSAFFLLRQISKFFSITTDFKFDRRY